MATETPEPTSEAIDAAEDHVFIFPPMAEPGTYAAIFAGCRELSYTDKLTKEDTTLLIWAFELEGTGDEPIIAEGVSSLLLSPRSKGFAWLRAIAPEIVAERAEIAASELVGRPCIVVLEAKEDDVRVSEVMPPMAGKGKPIRHEDERQ